MSTFSLRLIYHTEPILSCKIIGEGRESLIVFSAVIKLLSIYPGNRIDNEMIMRMIFIQMRADNNLKLITPHLCGKFHADLMCQCCIDFTGLE